MIRKLGFYIAMLPLIASYSTVQAKTITVGTNDGERINSYYDPERNYVADGYSYISIDSIIANELEHGDTIVLNSNEFYHVGETITKSVTIKAGDNYKPTLGYFDYDVQANGESIPFLKRVEFYALNDTAPLSSFEVTLDGLNVTSLHFRGDKQDMAVNKYALNVRNTTGNSFSFAVQNQEIAEANITNSTFDETRIFFYESLANTNEKQSSLTFNDSSVNKLSYIQSNTTLQLKSIGSTFTNLFVSGLVNSTLEDSNLNNIASFTKFGSFSMNRSTVNGYFSDYNNHSSEATDTIITNSIFIGTDGSKKACYRGSGVNSRLSNVTMTKCKEAIYLRDIIRNSPTVNHTFENILFLDNEAIYDPEYAPLNFESSFSHSLFDNLPNWLLPRFEGLNGNVMGTANVDENLNLLAGSLGVDIGNNNAAGIGPVDFNGNPRIQDSSGDGFAIVDIGATEVGTEVVVTEGLDLLSDVLNTISAIADASENLTAANSLYIGVAENYLTYSQNDLYWNDDNSLDETYGAYAMLHTGTAVAHLNLTANAPGTDPELKAELIEQTNRLVESMRLQATTKIDEAVTASGTQLYIGIANNYLNLGDDSRLNAAYPNQSLAVTYYRYAWTYANIAF